MHRPSGLTALAVFNFIIAGFLALGLLGLLILMGSDRSKLPPDLPETILYVRALFLVADVTLLIVAAIGYLRLKRLMGRWLGSVEALISLAYFIFVLSFTLGKGYPFMFSSLQQLVYPGITLVLLNVVFRENLVN